MSSRCPDAAAVGAACFLGFSVVCTMLASGCKREERRFRDSPTSAEVEKNAWATGEGARLYQWFNCVGCHAHGGGGMGPPLMDAKWLYGSSPDDVYRSIAEGRPNGMPAFRAKIADEEIWQLVAYVRSMSGQLAIDVAPGRQDSLSAKPPESLQRREELQP